MATAANPYDQQPAFWKDYLEARPQVPDSFFKRILNYHTEHGGQFDVLHDAGAGPGVHTTRLSKHFERVIVSDAAENNISIAETHLGTENNCFFRIAKLEDTDDLEPSCVDMLFATNVLHFTDIDQAMEAIAYQLKPGGTFVGAVAGVLAISDPKIHSIWLEITRRLNEVTVENEQMRPILIHGLSLVNNHYDTIPLDKKYFLPGAQRIRLGRAMNFHDFVPEALHPAIYLPSQVSEDDEAIVEDNDEWDFEIDASGIRKVFDTYRFDVSKDEKMMSLWRRLGEQMGENKVPAYWPGIMLLATRR